VARSARAEWIRGAAAEAALILVTWVLWVTFFLSNDYIKFYDHDWAPRGAFATQAECESEMQARFDETVTKAPPAKWTIVRTPSRVTMRTERTTAVTEGLCLPDTVDPRKRRQEDPKGDNR
jgi:hypothetical protein